MDIKDLSELRIQLGITRKELARWLHVSRGSVENWELGRSKISSASLFNYEQFLQDVIDGKIKPKISRNAGRNYKEEYRRRIMAEPQVRIADIVPNMPGKVPAVPAVSKPTPITPKYYKSKSGIEAIYYIEAFNLNFNLGNVIKYATRAGRKTENALEDLQKARWYLDREMERIKIKS